MRRSVTFALSAAALLAVVPVLEAQARAAVAGSLTPPIAARVLPAGSYEFTSTDDDGDVSTGAVSWSGQVMRIEMNRDRSRARRGNGNSASATVSNRRGEYTIVDFATNTVRTVKPEEREISEMPLQSFEQIIGKALSAVDGVVRMQVRDAGILGRDIGPGGSVAGIQTHQFRIIEEYNVNIGVFGMNAEQKHHRVVTDYWVPTAEGTPRNPMFELLTRSASATAQQDVAHQSNLTRTRAALFAGFPMRTVVTVTERGETAKRTSVEVTSLTTTPPDAALFVLPAGYRVKKNDLSFSI